MWEGLKILILLSFFVILKELNNTLSTEYGLPTWLSYGLFAVATIILGAVVGLILVCIIDFIWPQKAMQRQSFSEVQEKDKLIKRSNEMINEDLVDDTGTDQNNEDDEEEDETSEAEKISGSDDEEDEQQQEEEEVEEAPKEPSPKASPDVRKRRTRKAD